jgi:hypothetical protein
MLSQTRTIELIAPIGEVSLGKVRPAGIDRTLRPVEAVAQSCLRCLSAAVSR